MFARACSVCLRPLWAALILARVSGPWTCPCIAAARLAMVSGDCFKPLRQWGLVTGLGFFGTHAQRALAAADILARISALKCLPLIGWFALSLAARLEIVSGEAFLPNMPYEDLRPLSAAFILAIASGVCFMPRWFPGFPRLAAAILARTSWDASAPFSPPVVLLVRAEPDSIKWAIQYRSLSSQTSAGTSSISSITGRTPRRNSNFIQLERWLLRLWQSLTWADRRPASVMVVLPTYRTELSRGSM